MRFNVCRVNCLINVEQCNNVNNNFWVILISDNLFTQIRRAKHICTRKNLVRPSNVRDVHGKINKWNTSVVVRCDQMWHTGLFEQTKLSQASTHNARMIKWRRHRSATKQRKINQRGAMNPRARRPNPCTRTITSYDNYFCPRLAMATICHEGN